MTFGLRQSRRLAVVMLGFAAAGLIGGPSATASSMKLLPSVDTTCEGKSKSFDGPLIALASGGSRSTSDIHIACSDALGRMYYVRYSPGRGIVEKRRLLGPKLTTAWTNSAFNNPPYAISYSNGRVFIAWIGKGDNGRVQLVSRRGSGRFKRRQFRPTGDAFQIALASDKKGVYLAWSDDGHMLGSSCAEPSDLESCAAALVTFASITQSGIYKNNLLAGPQPCVGTNESGFGPGTTSYPSIAITDSGPVLAVADTCESEQHAKLDFRLLSSHGLEDYPAPTHAPDVLQYGPQLFQTQKGLYLLYQQERTDSDTPVLGAGGDLMLSRQNNGSWSPAETLEASNGSGALAVTKGRLYLQIAADIAQQTPSGLQRLRLPNGYYPGDMISVGNLLYFDAGYPRLGRLSVK